MMINKHRNILLPNISNFVLQKRGLPLTEEEYSHFIKCFTQITKNSEKLIFRGENRIKLAKTYGFTLNEFKDLLFDRIFMLGGKGRYFESPFDANISLMGQFSKNQYYFIFSMIQSLLKMVHKGSQEKFINNFKIRETDFCNYFLDDSNREDFYEEIRKMPSEEKIKTRDYYLGLLHNIDKSEYYSQSFFLSTTSNLKKAEIFAGYPRNSQNAVIFTGWIPPDSNSKLSAPSTGNFQKILNKTGANLPIYNKLIFYNQNEIALKGGLLPHYMVGYQFWDSGNIIFEVNPAFFDVGDEWDGNELPIDQGNFKSVLSKTTFSKFFAIDEKTGYYYDYFDSDDYEWIHQTLC